MSRQTFIFVSAPAQDAVHLIEQALGRQFIRAEGSDPYIRVGTVAVYVGGHEFDDDDIAWPQGSDIPLDHSKLCVLPLHFDLYGCGNLNTILCTLPQPYKKNCAGCHNHTIMAARSRRIMC